VDKYEDWGGKAGRQVAKLPARLPAQDLSGFESRHLSNICKWATLKRSGQNILARPNIKTNLVIEKKQPTPNTFSIG
jgi:hypothetical protein